LISWVSFLQFFYFWCFILTLGIKHFLWNFIGISEYIFILAKPWLNQPVCHEYGSSFSRLSLMPCIIAFYLYQKTIFANLFFWGLPEDKLLDINMPDRIWQ